MPQDRPREAPNLDLSDAEGLCTRLFFRPLEVRALVGYADANFLVTDDSGERFVLKVSGSDLDAAEVQFQVRTLRHLKACGWDSVPRPVRSRSGSYCELDPAAGEPRLARMLSYVDGEQMARLPELRRGLLESLGRFLGRLDLDLARLEDVPERDLDWDLARLGDTRWVADSIDSAVDRKLVSDTIDRFLERRASAAGELRRSLIHHDGNTHNVLVSSLDPATAEIAGLIDFGDLVVTETVFEVAVAATYAALDTEDPWEAALTVSRGYVLSNPLLEAELELLFAAVCARLALSVSMSATRRRLGTADAYALVSERQAWVTLRRLAALGESEANQRLRDALEPEEMTS